MGPTLKNCKLVFTSMLFYLQEYNLQEYRGSNSMMLKNTLTIMYDSSRHRFLVVSTLFRFEF